MLIRRPLWPSLLQSYLSSCSSRKFDYGVWDCALFVADAIREMTGTDLAAPLRNTYTCRREAVAAIAKYTGTSSVQSIADFIAKRNGMPEIPIAHASRGDMLLIRRAQGRDYSLAIVSLSGYAATIALRIGVGDIPLSAACRAWRV